MAEKRIHNPDESSSADVSRVSRSRDQDGHHTIYGKKPQLLCPVTVLVDSQVSDRCPWATCCNTYHENYIKSRTTKKHIKVLHYSILNLPHVDTIRKACMRKATICICENKAADQLCSNCTADQRLYFPIQR